MQGMKGRRVRHKHEIGGNCQVLMWDCCALKSSQKSEIQMVA